ncbi:unnamed protein product [Prorocentrum cordatum]|uniref:Uncharacterized protein n=1 Tax=Prorocentrum cordatum TaxID=2364126 RepID=A0ABN9UPM2_9DINO|nr:unnamed protein product [Polarella glacialis]
MQIWDTAGQEKFQSVTTHHYRAADGGLLVFDLASDGSFSNVDKWLAELRENTDPNVVVALVGTKADLRDRREVPLERAQAYAKDNGLIYMETSSYWDKQQDGSVQDTVAGVQRVFLRTMLRAIVHQQRKGGGGRSTRLDISGYGENGRGQVRLGADRGPRQGECGC